MEDILSSILSNFLTQFVVYLVMPVIAGFLLFAAWLNAEPVSPMKNWRRAALGFVFAIIVLMICGRISWPKNVPNQQLLIQTPAARVADSITYPDASPLPVTLTYTPTPTSTYTPTPTNTFTPTPTPTFTNTPFTPTPTPTPTVTLTPTITNTPDPRLTLPAICFSEPVRITTPRQNSEFDHNTKVDLYGAAYGDKDFKEIVVEYIQSKTTPGFDKVHNHGWQKIQTLEVLEDGEKKNAKRWGGNDNDQYMATWDWFNAYNNNDEFKDKISEGFRVRVWLRVRAVLDDANAQTPTNSLCFIWIYLKY